MHMIMQNYCGYKITKYMLQYYNSLKYRHLHPGTCSTVNILSVLLIVTLLKIDHNALLSIIICSNEVCLISQIFGEHNAPIIDYGNSKK